MNDVEMEVQASAGEYDGCKTAGRFVCLLSCDRGIWGKSGTKMERQALDDDALTIRPS